MSDRPRRGALSVSMDDVEHPLEPFWRGDALNRIWSLSALVIAGAAVFFSVAYVVGAIDKDLIAQLKRKPPAAPVDLAE